WEWYNLVSTMGAFVVAAGVLVCLVDLAINFRFSSSKPAGNVWRAGTLEWLPNHAYGTRSIPPVSTLKPLWDDAKLAGDVEAGRYYLPGAPTGGRETLVTSAVEAIPQYVLQVPGPSWRSFLAAVFTAAFFLLLTVKLVTLAFACGAVALVMIIAWLWQTDPGLNHPPVDIGGGMTLPVYVTGNTSHSWWAMVILLLVAASLFIALVFSYLYIWTVSPEVWPAAAGLPMPATLWPAASATAFVLSSAAVMFAGRMLARNWFVRLVMLLACCALAAALYFEFHGQWESGLRPSASSYGALVYTVIAVEGQLVLTALIMGLYTIARNASGMLSPVRRATYDNTMLFWHYTVGQGLLGLLIVHGFPRIAG
ncbi:MAG: cytochrome ubiquinol oxidase subunit I, partial [Rhizobiales bacterium]|nr:cytochrome ubiquinol oxidase subunit I [Hyphomicrobiales bacterium]